MASSEISPAADLLRRSLAGDAAAVRSLVGALAPVIQSRVARALLRRQGAAGGRNVRQEVQDLTQEVFASLFADGARALRAWDPGRGLPLEGFVGFVAERQIASILRTAKRSPWTEDPTLSETLEAQAGEDTSLEQALESRQLWEALLDRLHEALSPLGLSLFERLWVQERSAPEVATELGMTRDAVYAWQSRLGKLVRRLGTELMSETGAPAQRPKVGETT